MVEFYDKVSVQTSKMLTASYSTSFSIAIKMLNSKMQKAIYGIYGFVRIADEIVDTFHDYNQKKILDDFENQFKKDFQEGLSTNPILHSFIQTVKEYNIPMEQIDAFLKSMKADLHKNIYYSTDETQEYIYGSAEVVGLMCLRVFVDGNTQKYEELKDSAKYLGSAFQKVNFLRDLKADYEGLNRVYFANFTTDLFNEQMKNALVMDIKRDFDNAKIGIRKLPGKSKIAVWLAYAYFKQLLIKLERTPAKELISRRVRVNNFIKFLLLIRAYFNYKLRLI